MKLEDEIKQKKFSSEYHKIAVNMIYTCNWIVKETEKRLKSKGITLQQYNILRILRGQQQKPASINLIRERMIYRMPDVSRLVERLLIKGLVSKQDSSSDRRVANVMITRQGMSLLDELDSMQDDVDKLLSTLNDKEAKQLNMLLDKMRG